MPNGRVTLSSSSRNAVPGRGSSSSRSARSSSCSGRSIEAMGCPSGTTSIRSSSKRSRVTRSLPLTGRWRMARSSCPLASCGSSPVVVPSTMTRRSWGWRWAAASMRRGTSQRAVVPIIPTRTVPVTSSLQAATSDMSASSSDRMRRARATTTVPSAVRRPSARSMSGVPSSFSRRATWAEMLDWTVPRCSAAAENVPWSLMAVSAWRCRSSIVNKDTRYLDKLVD